MPDPRSGLHVPTIAVCTNTNGCWSGGMRTVVVSQPLWLMCSVLAWSF